MRLATNCVTLLLLADSSSAWVVPHFTKSYHQQHCHAKQRRRSVRAAVSLAELKTPENIDEFDNFLFGPPDPGAQMATAQHKTRHSRTVVKFGPTADSDKAVVMTSATATTMDEALQSTDSSETMEGEEAGEYDPYAEQDFRQQMGKIQQMQDQRPSVESRFKEMDLQDIIITLIIPAIVSFAGLRWGFNKVSKRVTEKADLLLDQFANEMIYHDGNNEEMRMCKADYSRQLVWMGPKKNDAMIKRFLEAYAKRKTVSPQAIASLSYVFALFKLSEEKAASVLVSLCREMGTDKISSAGKILFFGNRIFQSKEGKEALNPIKDMIKSTYRDATVAETLVETSQQAIGEAAYRATVQAGGKNQKSLTVGWEVLGLDKETATRIFDDEKEEGFVSDREAMYGGQTQKYDKKGRRIDDEGKLEDPEDDDDDDENDDAGPASNVYECSNCGYTLFIAKGREFKFYGDGFKCPECGAEKDKFEPKDIEG